MLEGYSDLETVSTTTRFTLFLILYTTNQSSNHLLRGPGRIPGEGEAFVSVPLHYASKNKKKKKDCRDFYLSFRTICQTSANPPLCYRLLSAWKFHPHRWGFCERRSDKLDFAVSFDAFSAPHMGKLQNLQTTTTNLLSAQLDLTKTGNCSEDGALLCPYRARSGDSPTPEKTTD